MFDWGFSISIGVWLSRARVLKISNDDPPSVVVGSTLRGDRFEFGITGYEGNHFATGQAVEENRLEQPSRNNRIIWISRILVGFGVWERVLLRDPGRERVAEHRETREGGGKGSNTFIDIESLLKRLRNGLLRRLYFAKIYKQLYIHR